MRRFKWIEWNLQKIHAHGLSADEVEAAFDQTPGSTRTDGLHVQQCRRTGRRSDHRHQRRAMAATASRQPLRWLLRAASRRAKDAATTHRT